MVAIRSAWTLYGNVSPAVSFHATTRNDTAGGESVPRSRYAPVASGIDGGAEARTGNGSIARRVEAPSAVRITAT